MHSLTATLLAGFLLLALPSLPLPYTQSQPQRELLTNEKVIELVKLGFGDDLIIAKIRQSERRFDTSVEGLKQLKANRVSERVIQEMMASAPDAPSPGVSPPLTDDLRKPPQVVIRHTLATVRDTIKQELRKETGTRLVSEQPQQLVFRRKATGAQNYFSSMIRGGLKLEHQVTFSLEANEGGRDITIVADTMNIVVKPEGQEEQAGSPNQNKNYRPAILQLLATLKAKIESLPLPPEPPPVARTEPTVQSHTTPSNESIEFTLPLNAAKHGFSYRPRSILYQGKALAFAQRLTPKDFPTLKISLLKNLTYAAIIADNPDGFHQGYVLNLASGQIISIQQEEKGTSAIKALWSPLLHYVVFHCAYEGERFISVHLPTGRVTKGDFLKAPNRRWATKEPMRWLTFHDVLAFQVEEFCDPYEDARCTDSKMNQVLAVREVYLDAQTAQPSLQNPTPVFTLNEFSLPELQKLGVDVWGCSSLYAGNAQSYRAQRYYFWAKWGQTREPDSAWIKLDGKLIRLKKAGATPDRWAGGGVEVILNVKKVTTGGAEGNYYKGEITVQRPGYSFGRQIEGESGC